MSGGRDFNELSAKFEKTVRRMPDYAHRAQQQLQKYTGDGQADERGRSGATRSPSPAEPAVVAEIRDKWVRWNDPAAKLERRRRRTSRALTLWIVATLLSVLWAVVGYTGLTGVADGIEGAFTGVAATLVFGTLGVRTGLRLRRLNRTPLPERTSAPPALPAAGSAAREPMELLRRSEASLTELLTQLETPHGGSTSVPAFSVSDARATATEAAAALRALAARIESIERAQASAPDDERRTLEAAVEKLREQLDDGMDEYGTLVAAAGRAVAASSSGIRPAREALTDATDRLAGLASALRELSGER